MAVLADNHNSVLRPLFNGVGRLPDVLISVDQVEHLEADWLVVPHCSNVTGTVYDLARLCRTAHARGARVLVDAAQSVGCVPVDVEGWGVDALAFTGHKALYGPQGTGGYYVSPDVALRPTVFGGTGTDSNAQAVESSVSSEVESATIEEARKAAQDSDTLMIRVKEKNIFINDYLCTDIDEFGKTMEDFYEDGMNITVIDDYADSEPYSSVTGYLKDNAYEYLVEAK